MDGTERMCSLVSSCPAHRQDSPVEVLSRFIYCGLGNTNQCVQPYELHSFYTSLHCNWDLFICIHI